MIDIGNHFPLIQLFPTSGSRFLCSPSSSVIVTIYCYPLFAFQSRIEIDFVCPPSSIHLLSLLKSGSWKEYPHLLFHSTLPNIMDKLSLWQLCWFKEKEREREREGSTINIYPKVHWDLCTTSSSSTFRPSILEAVHLEQPAAWEAPRKGILLGVSRSTWGEGSEITL